MFSRLVLRTSARPLLARVPLMAVRAPLSTTAYLQLPKTVKETKPKRASPKPKATKPAKKETKPKAKKDKPWEARDTNGKLLPLPMENKPTRRSSFLIYFSERLPQLKEKTEYRKISPASGKSVVDVTAITTAVGAEWKSLSPAERARIDELAEKAKAQYEKDLAKWQDSLTPDAIRRQNLYYAHQRKLGKSVPSNLKDPAAPKRPPGAFFLYVQHLRENGHDHLPVQELAKLAGERWKAMNASDKHPFESKAQSDYETYTKEHEAYKKSAGLA